MLTPVAWPLLVPRACNGGNHSRVPSCILLLYSRLPCYFRGLKLPPNSCSSQCAPTSSSPNTPLVLKLGRHPKKHTTAAHRAPPPSTNCPQQQDGDSRILSRHEARTDTQFGSPHAPRLLCGLCERPRWVSSCHRWLLVRRKQRLGPEYHPAALQAPIDGDISLHDMLFSGRLARIRIAAAASTVLLETAAAAAERATRARHCAFSMQHLTSTHCLPAVACCRCCQQRMKTMLSQQLPATPLAMPWPLSKPV